MKILQQVKEYVIRRAYRIDNHERNRYMATYPGEPGEIYEILYIADCSGKTARSRKSCSQGGPLDCPGRCHISGPFDKYGVDCWSWGKDSLFEYFVKLEDE